MDNATFDDEEVARLVSFIFDHMEMNADERKEWLMGCTGNVQGNPIVLSRVIEDWGDEDIYSIDDVLHMIAMNSAEMPNPGDGFFRLFEEGIEHGLFKINDDECIQTLTHTIMEETDVLNPSDINRMARYFTLIGCHCKSKRNLGKYFDNYRLRYWDLNDGELENGFEIIFQTITGEFFQDLKGFLNNFLEGFVEEGGEEYSEELETYLKNRGLNEDGVIMDSDADSKGNLAGFIESDESEEDEDVDEDEDEDAVEDSEAVQAQEIDGQTAKQKKRWINRGNYDKQEKDGACDEWDTEEEDEEEVKKVHQQHKKPRLIEEDEEDEEDSEEDEEDSDDDENDGY